MLVGKVVEFKPRGILPDSVIGRVLLNNIDVSQQLLRDGAARHVAKELTGQVKNEFDVYASLETAAKTEKRGVWALASITTTRAENVNADPPRPVLAAVSRRGSSPVPAVPDASQLLESWVTSLPLDRKAATSLKTHTDPIRPYTSISTPHAVLEFASEGGKQTVECRAIYAVAGSLRGRGEPLFLLGFRPTLKENDPLKGAGSMTVVVERYVVPLTPVEGAIEMRYYRISKAFLMRIANTRTVELQLDGSKAALSEEAKEFFKQLLSASK
jgi:endonuclease YncB( thermonuclease family)